MHSWIFRNRRRLERLYGLAPTRPEPGSAVPAAKARRAAEPRAPLDQVPRPLPARVLVPAPRRVA